MTRVAARGERKGTSCRSSGGAHNGFIIEKAFVRGVICLSKWLEKKVFPKGIYGLWSPQAPSHIHRHRRLPAIWAGWGLSARGGRVFIGSEALTFLAGGGAASSSGAVKKGFENIILNIIILKN